MNRELEIILVSALILIGIVMTVSTIAQLNAYTIHARTITIHALAVTGTQGEVLNISITLLTPGDGNAYIAAIPLPAYGPGGEGQMFIASAQLAYYIASMLAWKQPFNHSVLIKVEGNIVEVGGPSASAYMTAAIFALLTNTTMSQDITMTGMILPGGLVGPVGDVPIKIEAAARAGYRTVIVPLLNYVTLPKMNYNINVVPVIDVEQAIYYFTGIQLVNNSVKLEDILKMNEDIVDILHYIWTTIDTEFKKLDLTKITLRQAEDVFKLVNKAREEAKQGDYYTAASLMYQAIVRYYKYLYIDQYNTLAEEYGIDYAIQHFNNIAKNLESMVKEIEGKVGSAKPTIYTIDLLIGIYERIIEAKDYIKSYYSGLSQESIRDALYALALATARVISLKTWLEVLNYVEEKFPAKVIDSEILSKVAEIYLQYCKAMIGYGLLIKIVGEYQALKQALSKMIELYQEKKYVQVIGLSFHYLSDITYGLVYGFLKYSLPRGLSENTVKLLKIEGIALRQSALTRTYELINRGLLPIYSIMYIQFGNYYLESLNASNTSDIAEKIAQIYGDYLLAKLHDDIVEFVHLSSRSGLPLSKIVIGQENITRGIRRPVLPTSANLYSVEEIRFNIPIIALGVTVFLAGILLVVVFVLLEKRST